MTFIYFICIGLLAVSTSKCQVVDVNFGHGCPGRWSKCINYCNSEAGGSRLGFCWKVICVCMPKMIDKQDILRAFDQAREKMARLLENSKN